MYKKDAFIYYREPKNMITNKYLGSFEIVAEEH